MLKGNKVNTSKLDESPENREESHQKSIPNILRDFCEYTSCGGLGRVVTVKHLAFKALWVMLFLTAVGTSISQLVMLFEKYKSKPINTKISLEYSAVLTFPSVTFCNFNIIRKSQIHKLPWSLQEALKDGNFFIYDDFQQGHLVNLREFSLGNMECPLNEASMFSNQCQFHAVHDECSVRNSNTTETPPTVSGNDDFDDPDQFDKQFKNKEKLLILLAKADLKTIAPLGQTFDSMIRSCEFKGVDCRNLQRFWSTFWHYKYGNCYIFNSHINGKFYNGLKTTKTGPLYGLHVELNVEQEEYINQLTENAGMVTVISNHGVMPFPSEEGISLAPGFSTSIGTKRVHIKRVDAFQNNSCVETTAGTTQNLYADYFNVSYSKTACIQSCIAYNQMKYCKCIEYKFSNFNNESVCDTLNKTTVGCLNIVATKAQMNKLNCSTECPPPCSEDVFHITSSFSVWPSTNFRVPLTKELEKQNKNKSSDLSNNLLRVNIFYQELNFEKIEQQVSYQFENFLADIGGQLGLWLGVSVLTGVEVVELLLLMVLHLISKKKKKGTGTNVIEMEEGTPN